MTATAKTSLHRFASPAAFMRVSRIAFPVVMLLAALCLSIGLYKALFDSPPDYQQGEFVRIMYIHVPSAWLSTMLYGVMAVLSVSYLVWRHPLADILARETAPIGAAFTFITLVTGSLWGKPMWGAYWVWDARLTSMLILFFLYMGYIMLSRAAESSERLRTSSAWLCIVGAINLPIIKFSVDWWNTLHQGASILRLDGPTIDNSMLMPLLTCIAGFTLLALALVLLRAEAALNEQKIRRLQRKMMLAKTRENDSMSEL